MPSIAQQDYIKIEGENYNDCHLLAGLAKALQNGTLFDCVFKSIMNSSIFRITALNPNAPIARAYFIDAEDGAIGEIDIEYTQTQYEGLAAIQDAAGHYDQLPEFEQDSDGYLYASCGSDDLVTVGGKKLAVTVSGDDTIAALAISNEEYSGFEITWEDAQKLIGIYCVGL